MTRVLVLALLFSSVCCATTKAQTATGEQLQSKCKGLVGAAKGVETFSGGFCAGFVEGVIESQYMWEAADSDEGEVSYRAFVFRRKPNCPASIRRPFKQPSENGFPVSGSRPPAIRRRPFTSAYSFRLVFSCSKRSSIYSLSQTFTHSTELRIPFGSCFVLQVSRPKFAIRSATCSCGHFLSSRCSSD